MSVISLDYKKSKNRAKELKSFLLKLDSVCDVLYDNLNYDGMWDVIDKIESVRVKYYLEYHEYQNVVEMRKK